MIIGGGVIGSSVAYHLTERGVSDVVILERDSEQGKGSTGKATGGIRSQFETDINIRMSLHSLEFLKNCEFQTGYDPRGYLFFATTEEQMDYLHLNSAKQASIGVNGISVIDAKEVAKIVPGLNCDDILGGSFGATDGFINPLAVMRGFTERAVSKGAEIRFDTQATAFLTEGGKISGVETKQGIIECDAAVLCTGAWAKQLAATADIDLPIEPQRRQIVWARTSKPLPAKLPMVIDIGTGFHFRPAVDFHDPTQSGECDVLFAYPDPYEPNSLNMDFDEAFIEKVYEKAKVRAPFLFDSEVVREKCRAGLYENTPDHHPILGGCEVGGLYFANGFSGHGVMHSPAAGRALSEIILDGRASFLDVSSLGLDRFAKGEMLHETAFI